MSHGKDQKNTMAERNTNTWLDTSDPQVFIKNSAKFNDLMMMYRCTVREVRTKLEVLNDEFSLEYKRIRVVCAFIDDIYTIADLITRQDDITVIQVKDYIKNPKPNGYRSYHMIVEIPVFFSKGKTPMRAEIQIRTNGMDFWATLEHQLRYKQNIEEMDGYEEVSNELLNCARAVIDMDNEMQRIKNKIGQFHDI